MTGHWTPLSIFAFSALTLHHKVPTHQTACPYYRWRSAGDRHWWRWWAYRDERFNASCRWAGILGLRALHRLPTYFTSDRRCSNATKHHMNGFSDNTRPSFVHFASRKKTYRGDSVHEGLNGLIWLAMAHAVTHPHRFLLPASSHSPWTFLTLLATWTNATIG